MKDRLGSQTLESMSQAVWYNRWTLEKFAKFLGGEILEVGCGIGNFTKYLTKYGKLTAIDIDRDYIKEAKEQISEPVEVGWGDIEKGQYFFNRKSFDTVVCLNVLEHVEDDLRVLKNIQKLLKKDGILVLLVPAHKVLYNLIDESIGHLRRYEKNNLKQLLKESNFEIDKIINLNFLGGVGWFIAGKLLKDTEVRENKIKIFNFFAPFFFFLENIFKPPFGTSILVIAKKRK